jgi:type I restriction enzyme S subunit
MASEWVEKSLDELCSLITDGKHGDSIDKSNSGFYFLSVKDIYDNRLVYDNARQIAEKDFNETHRRTNLEPGDILFTNTGTIGRMAIASDDPRTTRTTFQKSVAILKPKRDLIQSEFLYYLLKFDNAKLSGLAAGTTQQNLLIRDLKTFSVQVPPLREQHGIVHILGTLDDKIELNRRMNKMLEEIAQAIFKSWFVDFDQNNTVIDLDDGIVGDLVSISRDSIAPGEFPEEIFDHYSIPAYDEGRKPKPEKGNTIKSNKFIVKPDSVLISKLNPRIPRIWLPDLRGKSRSICSTEFLVMEPKKGVTQEFLFCFFSNKEFFRNFATMVTGTSGSHQRVKPEGLLAMSTVIPPRELINDFTKIIAPLFKRIKNNIAESSTLAALRNVLLPKLMSGEVRVHNLN